MSIHFPKPSHLSRHSTTSLRVLVLSLGLLATPAAATAEIVPVCDRTPEVRDEIVKLVPEVSDCADVTESHLAEIRRDFFHGGLERVYVLGFPSTRRLPPPPLRELKVGDFSGLSSLRTLYLDRTGLMTLPEGIFSGLSSLEALYLDNNGLSTLPAEVFSGLSSLLYHNSGKISSCITVELLRPLLPGEALPVTMGTLPAEVFSGLSSLSTLPAEVFSGSLPA